MGEKVQVRWRLNQGLRPIQVLLDHKRKFICKYHCNIDLYDTAKNVPFIQWPELLYSRLDDIDVSVVLMHYACIWGVFKKYQQFLTLIAGWFLCNETF